MDKKEEESEVTIDSAGQANPAVDLERKNIQESKDRQEGKAAPHEEAIAAKPDEETLEEHTVEELRGIAASEGAELHNTMVKSDIIKAIKKKRKK